MACLFLCVMLLLDNVLPVIALLICEALQECLKFRFWVLSVFLLACPQVHLCARVPAHLLYCL